MSCVLKANGIAVQQLLVFENSGKVLHKYRTINLNLKHNLK